VACGIPIGSKRQQAERKLKSLVSRMLQDEEPRAADLHEGRMPGAEDDEELGPGVCPSYVSLTGNEGGRLQVDDEYCDKNCRMGFCPTDKCRCSTDEDTSRHGLIGTPEDACPKYVTLDGEGGKSKFNQVDDDWCDSNCRGNFLSCPKDKCRCFTDTKALKDYRDDMAREKARDAMVKEKVAAPTAATEEESLGGNCPKFVGLAGAVDANPKFKRWAAGANDDEFCEKNCRAGFCPEAKCRCITDPEPEAAAAADLPVAPVAPVVPLPVAPEVPVVAPLVAPTAPVPAAEDLAGNCPSFVGLAGGQAKSKFNKVFMTDDEYCEKNCRAGFCPETRCRCSTDPEPEPSDAGAEEAAAVELPVAPVAANAPAAAKDDCPSYVSNLPPAGEKKGPFKRVDDEYCEKNCRQGFCPEASCRCSTEPPPESSLAVDEAEPAVDWRKNRQNPPAPAQPAAWWKKDKAGAKSDVTGDDFADDGADWEPKGSHQQDDLGATDDSWLDGAEVYEEGADEGPTIARGSASSLEALAQALVLGDISVASLSSARRSVK
jgi:hypothetical protein